MIETNATEIRTLISVTIDEGNLRKKIERPRIKTITKAYTAELLRVSIGSAPISCSRYASKKIVTNTSPTRPNPSVVA